MFRGRDERGAIMPMTALLLTVVLGFTAFAVDLGLQRVAIRDMQALADAAALDAARRLPSCNGTMLSAAANDTRARHGEVIGEDKPLVAVPGHMDSVTKRFVAGASGGVCDAVQVAAGTSVGFAFAPGSGEANRHAVATRDEPGVCISVGTKTLTLDTSEGALGPLLDHILKVKLDVLGYAGLVDLKDLSVPLLDLAVELGVGSADELLELSEVSLMDFMLATAGVLRRQGDLVEATLLESVATQISGVTVDLGEILNVGTGGDAALNATINALDLIGVAIVAANGSSSIAVPDLGIALPGNLLNANASVVITDPPQVACGGIGTTARSAQIKVQLKGDVNAAAVAGAKLELSVGVGNGSATVTDLACTQPEKVSVSATTSAASIGGYGTSPNALLQLTVLPSQYDGFLIGALLLPLRLLLGTLKLDVKLTGSVGSGGPYAHTFTYPAAPALPGERIFNSGKALALDSSVSLSPGQGGLLGLIGSLLNPLLSVLFDGIVDPLVNTVVSPLLSGILNPLTNALGLKLGVAEVNVLGRPECNAVKLAG